ALTRFVAASAPTLKTVNRDSGRDEEPFVDRSKRTTPSLFVAIQNTPFPASTKSLITGAGSPVSIVSFANLLPSKRLIPPAVQNQRNPRESRTMRMTLLWTSPSAVE